MVPPAAGTPVVTETPDTPTPPRGFGIEGVVLGAPEGRPIAGATITAEDLGRTVSGDDGSFALFLDNFDAVRQEKYQLARGRELVVGRLTFVIEAPGYAPWTISDLDVYPDGGLTSFTPLLGQDPVTLDYNCTPVPIRAMKKGCRSTSLREGGSHQPLAAKAGSAGPAALNACQTDTVSYVTPPDTIRVWDNNPLYNPDYLVHTVNFKTYVKEVIAREIYDTWPREVLEVQAMASRDYGWYYVNNWQTANVVPSGYPSAGQCYDIHGIGDGGRYQEWGEGGTKPRTNVAVDAIWAASRAMQVSVQYGEFETAETGYVSGYTTDTCGELEGSFTLPGNIMSQYGAYDCVLSPFNWQWNAVHREYYFSSARPLTLLDDATTATEYLPSYGAQLNVYAVGNLGHVKENFAVLSGTNDSWSTWHINLAGSCSSAPASLAYLETHLWIFCRKSDVNGTIQAKRWNGSSWGTWTNSLGSGGSAGFRTGPAATEYGQPIGGGNVSYHLNVYAVGWDGNVYENYYDVSGNWWRGWLSLGSPSGGCTSTPGADWRTQTDLVVACRGGDGAIYAKVWNGSAWGAWSSLGGSSLTSAGLTDFDGSQGWELDAYMLDGANTVGSARENIRRGTGWLGWGSSFGRCAGGVGASDRGGGSPYEYVTCRVDTNAAGVIEVEYRRWTGTGWQAWVNIGAP